MTAIRMWASRAGQKDHLTEAVGRQRRHHAHQFGGGEIGAKADETCVERHQFALRAGRAPEQGPGEVGQVVDFDDEFGKLGVADGERERLPRGIEAGISRRRLAPRQPQFTVLDCAFRSIVITFSRNG